jgi:hypothetical protein
VSVAEQARAAVEALSVMTLVVDDDRVTALEHASQALAHVEAIVGALGGRTTARFVRRVDDRVVVVERPRRRATP